MKKYFFFLFMFCNLGFAQEVGVELLEEKPLTADIFIGVDNFGAIYFIQNQTFYKQRGIVVNQFTDLQLGEINHVDILNPLQIILFYKNANVAVIVDNNLNEIKRLKFNQLDPYRTIGYVGAASENNLWIFNVDEQRLEIVNVNRRRNVPQAPPIKEEITGFASNFNYCWIFTAKGVKMYNIYGVLVKEWPIKDVGEASQDDANLIFRKDNKLWLLKKSEEAPKSIKLPDNHVAQFYFNAEMLYIYNKQFIRQYRIIQPKN